MSTEQNTSVSENLRSLAQGLNPFTGEALAPGHPMQEPDFIRLMFSAVSELESRKPRRQKNAPANAGRPWKPLDDEELTQAARTGATVADLMKQFERTRNAIQLRLEHLGVQAGDADTQPAGKARNKPTRKARPA